MLVFILKWGAVVLPPFVMAYAFGIVIENAIMARMK